MSYYVSHSPNYKLHLSSSHFLSFCEFSPLFLFSSFFFKKKRQRMVVKHVVCTDQSHSKLEHISGVFPWGCLGTVRTVLWRALACPETSKKILNYPRCQLHPARWSGIFHCWSQTDPAKMAHSHQLYVTHRKTMSLRSGSFEWLLSGKCVTVTFLRDLGGEDQSSLICGMGTLPLPND